MEATQTSAQSPNVSSTPWYYSLKDNLKSWFDNLDLNSYRVIEIASYFAIGFFFGFLLKRHAKLLVSSLIILIIVLIVCTYFDLFFINWTKVREVINVNPNDTLGALVQNYINWLKQNIILIISALVGTLLGYNVG